MNLCRNIKWVCVCGGIALMLYSVCCTFNLVTPVFECPEFEEK